MNTVVLIYGRHLGLKAASKRGETFGLHVVYRNSGDLDRFWDVEVPGDIPGQPVSVLSMYDAHGGITYLRSN
jgi:hypothetical protein